MQPTFITGACFQFFTRKIRCAMDYSVENEEVKLAFLKFFFHPALQYSITSSLTDHI